MLSPVVVSADTVGNVIGTRDYVPGSLLLPALDSKLRKLLGAQAPFLTSMLACGHIQIRNAYPCSGGERLLPVPAALMAEKENPGTIINAFHEDPNDKTQRKQLRAGYTPSDGLPVTSQDKTLVMVKTAATTHAVVDDEFQRPTKRVGGVYTYEAIRAEQTFRAELWIAKSVLKTPPDPAQLNGEERIGRAKKDDYGRVGITASAAAENKTGPAGKTFTLWLVSPLLVRDNRLRYINDAAAFALWLGTHHKAKLKLDSAFVRSFRDDGWNTAWNEPRPTRFGLAAGSCFQFSSGEEIDGKWLAALEAEGLGERRGEGYGEVRVNALILEQGVPKQVTLANGSKLLHPAYELNPTEFTRQLQLRAWRIGIRRQAVANAESFAECLDWKNKGPPNSQLGALRGLFEGWVTEADRARLGTWLERLRDIPKREEKWPKKTLKVLDSFVESDDAVWSRLEVGKLPLLPCHKLDEMKKAMAAEATRILWLTAIAVEFDRRVMLEKQESPQPESVEN